METLPHFDLASPNLVEGSRNALREMFLEAFDEHGQIDFSRLKELLGELADGDKSRYGLSWAGKQDAKRALLSQSVGTLEPMRGESVEFDETENLIIEGDNLEVLKLLQKAYYGKVKMIYIDPPYNTGNDFIYPDNFREGLQDYLKYSGQVSEEGFRTSSNTETSGRYHSNWLNMMYPRLALARNLLREDGVIFVSIDDHEVHNLRMLMDEVFGEENFVQNFMWLHGKGKKDTWSRTLQQYILAYARNKPSLPPWKIRASANYEFSNPDGDPRGPWFSGSISFSEERSNQKHPNFYEITSPSGKVWCRQWQCDFDEMKELLDEKRIFFGSSPDYLNVPRKKIFPGDEEDLIPPNIIEDVETTRQAQSDLDKLLGGRRFEFPKPVGLVKLFAGLVAGDGDIILDFFAGSGTTAQAVMELNHEDGGNRRFILVQLPEPLDPPITLDDGTTLNTIADICRVRVRRAAKKLNAKTEGKLDLEKAKPDRGFRSFKLTSSNFKLWEDATGGDSEKLKEQLKLYAENVLPDRQPESVLCEILLKSGLEISANIERLESDTFSVGGRLIVCLDDPVDEARLRELIESAAEKIVCLDHGFRGNDALKANIAQQVKQWNAHHPEKTLDFRTV